MWLFWALVPSLHVCGCDGNVANETFSETEEFPIACVWLHGHLSICQISST